MLLTSYRERGSFSLLTLFAILLNLTLNIIKQFVLHQLNLVCKSQESYTNSRV